MDRINDTLQEITFTIEPGETKKVLMRSSSATEYISEVMFRTRPTTGGVRRKPRTLPEGDGTEISNVVNANLPTESAEPVQVKCTDLRIVSLVVGEVKMIWVSFALSRESADA